MGLSFPSYKMGPRVIMAGHTTSREKAPSLLPAKGLSPPLLRGGLPLWPSSWHLSQGWEVSGGWESGRGWSSGFSEGTFLSVGSLCEQRDSVIITFIIHINSCLSDTSEDLPFIISQQSCQVETPSIPILK